MILCVCEGGGGRRGRRRGRGSTSSSSRSSHTFSYSLDENRIITGHDESETALVAMDQNDSRLRIGTDAGTGRRIAVRRIRRCPLQHSATLVSCCCCCWPVRLVQPNNIKIVLLHLFLVLKTSNSTIPRTTCTRFTSNNFICLQFLFISLTHFPFNLLIYFYVKLYDQQLYWFTF